MRRKAEHRLWTLLLTLLLLGGSTVSVPRIVQAGTTPGEPAPPVPPDPTAGDPDWPSGKAPKPSPGVGLRQPGSTRDTPVQRKDRTFSWLWSVRVAFSGLFRIFFRI